MSLKSVNIPFVLNHLAYGARYHVKGEYRAGYEFDELIAYLPENTPLDEGEWLLTPENRPTDEQILTWWVNYSALPPVPTEEERIAALEAMIFELILVNEVLAAQLGGS